MVRASEIIDNLYKHIATLEGSLDNKAAFLGTMMIMYLEIEAEIDILTQEDE